MSNNNQPDTHQFNHVPYSVNAMSTSTPNTSTEKGPHAKANHGLLAKLFHRRPSPSPSKQSTTTTDTEKTIVPPQTESNFPPKENLGNDNPNLQAPGEGRGRMKSLTPEDHAAHSDLMRKAEIMDPEEFKVYLKEHKEEVESVYRRQGGGLGGEWMTRGSMSGTWT
jgi:hypothetical protein